MDGDKLDRSRRQREAKPVIDAVDGSFHRRGNANEVVADKVTTTSKEPHEDGHHFGLDIAKSVAGQSRLRKALKRGRVLLFFMKLPPCLVGIEARAFTLR